MPPRSSVIVTRNESSPISLFLGIYFHSPDAGSMDASPLIGPVAGAIVYTDPSTIPSISDVNSLPLISVFLNPLPLVPAVTILGSSTGLIVRDIS